MDLLNAFILTAAVNPPIRYQATVSTFVLLKRVIGASLKPISFVKINAPTPAAVPRTAPRIIKFFLFPKPISEKYKALDKIVSTTGLDTLKDYLAFHFASTFAPYLSKPFATANFDFYKKTLRGAQSERPRWKRVLDAEEAAIGEGLGESVAAQGFDRLRHRPRSAPVRETAAARREHASFRIQRSDAASG